MTRSWHVVHADDANLLAAGREVVLAASAATGHPDPRVWPAERLARHTAARQARAETVLVAVSAPDRRCVGHALVVKEAPDTAFSALPELAEEAAHGRLRQLGGLAVLPAQQRQGVAADLVEACIRHTLVMAPDAVLVAAVWPTGPSAAWAGRLWEPVGELVNSDGQTLNILRRPGPTEGVAL